jgi:riboflavin biosynthesis pyrimidine reductase
MSVIASMVVGSDGSTSKDSKSAGVSSPADRRAFLSRRRNVDCIIIGGNTARNEPYNRTPVPLVVLSRSLVNPVMGNHLANVWNASPAEAVERATRKFGSNILIEGGFSMISELLDANLLDGLELSVTPETGGEGYIDWKELIARFDSYEITEDEETFFYHAIKKQK